MLAEWLLNHTGTLLSWVVGAITFRQDKELTELNLAVIFP
jgi:hypothetical protein